MLRSASHHTDHIIDETQRRLSPEVLPAMHRYYLAAARGAVVTFGSNF
jgi:hypothetical protein